MLALAADGSLTCMTPTGSDTGARNGKLFFQIKSRARATGGWKAFDSSTGFRLPDDSVLSPDASLVALDGWQSLTAEQRRSIAPLCPDLVVELANPSDEGPRGLTALRKKMAAYQRNGARLGWLLLPVDGRWRYGNCWRIPRPSRGESKRPLGLREMPSSPGWGWSLRRSGRADGHQFPLAHGRETRRKGSRRKRR
ncbi:MAG: hypothetical protein RLZZ216_2579 [Cyanobacteriota bacterium]